MAIDRSDHLSRTRGGNRLSWVIIALTCALLLATMLTSEGTAVVHEDTTAAIAAGEEVDDAQSVAWHEQDLRWPPVRLSETVSTASSGRSEIAGSNETLSMR